MDSLTSAAARALAAGDALGALRHVALRDDAPALALRGIAMAQLGELARARELLRRAHDTFGAAHALPRARCRVAAAEVALAQRDFTGAALGLDAARAVLEARGDTANALHARLVAARSLLLLGRLEAALQALGPDEGDAPAPPAGRAPAAVRATAALLHAEVALRRLQLPAARAALARAQAAAQAAGVPALQAEVVELSGVLAQPAARRLVAGHSQPLRLDDVAALRAAPGLLVDACRHGLQAGPDWRPLARRPVLFTLLRTLAEAWPGDVARADLIAAAFRTRHPDETHRARLRVEIGRLRPLLGGAATLPATPRGFRLQVPAGRDVAVLAPPVEGSEGELLALLADGAPWSTSALALALRASQRTVQRALAALVEAGRVRAVGQGRTRRWLAPPLGGFTTILLLPSALPPG